MIWRSGTIIVTYVLEDGPILCHPVRRALRPRRGVEGGERLAVVKSKASKVQGAV